LDYLAVLGANPARALINLLDILIVSYLFYRLLLIISGTRAEQLLKGLVVLLLFSALTRWMGLAVVTWLIDKLWTGVFIALPVVFQPELRRALEHIGRGGLLPRGFIDGYDQLQKQIEIVVDAVEELAQRGIGALIVWERETGIKDYLDIGVEVDGIISKEMIETIFYPNNPLHDGAVVIKDGRIKKAGAFLPLSDNPHLDKDLGTRHRAAVGISEVSDALALVVSEERRTISLAKEGGMERNLSKDKLKEILMRELGGRNTLKNFSLWRKSFDQ